MPPGIDLLYAIGLPPEKAIEYFKSKGYEITWNWYDMLGEAHNKAFIVAKAMNQDILDDIRSMVQKALDEGITVQQFQNELEPMLKAKGWWGTLETPDGNVQLGSPYRLKTIYRTNMQVSYMAGRERSQLENVDNRPFWEYVAIMDARTRPAHAALHGRVFRYDDPFWDSFYPPNGFNCRCRVRALDGAEVQQKGLRIEETAMNGSLQTENRMIDRTGKEEQVGVYTTSTGIKIRPDPGWSYNPGKN